ncbi:MAG: enoyl-CoA hydratase-related protein [Acidobacteriota bacterium]|nr:enoyl-CoA hydratase-related protein [Acidobacteriota bacterium]
MSDFRFVRLEAADNGVRTVTLDRPPVNALGRDLVEELGSTWEHLRGDADARCVVVRSAGKHFCGGADLKERREMTLDDVRAFVPRLAGAVNGLAGLPVPTIAAVRGAAAGGGCELALACDLRVLAENASIGLRETALAILPGAGGTQRLPRLIGPARAKRWIFTARMHSASDALADGVADGVVTNDRLDDEVSALAAEIAANGPIANRLAKRAIDRGAHLGMDDALALEWECYQGTIETEDRLEALRAFAEKRAPNFRGR